MDGSVKKKKKRKRREKRSPEQIAATCKNAIDAYKQGMDVHRAYLQQKINAMNNTEKQITMEAINSIMQLKDPKLQSDALKKFRMARTKEEIENVIKENKEKINEKNSETK